MSIETCSQCQHYIQHYGVQNGAIYRLNCGHCRDFHKKRKLPDTKACEHFVFGPGGENSFVRKEYLSKALLLRVLNMELLPEILDAPPDP